MYRRFFSILPRPPISTLFPYTTLFRSYVPAEHSARVPRICGGGAQAANRGFSTAGNLDRKSTRLNSSHLGISYAVFCLKKKNAKIEELRQVLGKMTGKMVKVNIFEIRYPELDAYLIAENVAQQLERRVSFRKVLKQTVQRSMKSGAKGVRVAVSGRLRGARVNRRAA